MAHAELTGKFTRDLAQSRALREPLRSQHVQCQIVVAETEPRRAAERRERLHERPCFLCTAPAALGIGHTAQRVEQRVDVRADVQPEVYEIIACIRYDQELIGLEDLRKSVHELRPAHASRERHDAASYAH